MDTQFKKGALELCVLSLLAAGECYGYELVTVISKTIAISEGTIYPLLNRLKADGFVETYLQESNEGPPRKYYRLSPEGATHYTALKAEWNQFVKSVSNILEGTHD